MIWFFDDGLVIMASEVGVLPVEPKSIKRKGRLQPGKMFLVDTVEGRIVDDKEIKERLATRHPYAEIIVRGEQEDPASSHRNHRTDAGMERSEAPGQMPRGQFV